MFSADIFLNGKKIVFDNILVAGGRPPSKKWFSKVAKNKVIYCADSGIDICYKSKVLPKVVVGDMDSCSKDALEWAVENKVPVKRASVYKDDTDFKLVLVDVIMETTGNILCTGVWGGRFDHLYSIVNYIMTAQKNINYSIVMADHKECMFFVTEGACKAKIVNTEKIDNISLLPINEEAIVSISGVRWSLKDKFISTEDVFSISNIPKPMQDVNISVKKGCVGVYIKIK